MAPSCDALRSCNCLSSAVNLRSSTRLFVNPVSVRCAHRRCASAIARDTLGEEWIRASLEDLLHRTMRLKKGRVGVRTCCSVGVRDGDPAMGLASNHAGTFVVLCKYPLQGVVQAAVR